MQHDQIILQQDHGGGLLGHVHGAIDRDANVGGVQRRRVVDTVSQVAHHVATCLERQQHTVFLLRVGAAEQVDLFHPRTQGIVVHGCNLGATEHAIDRDAQFGADMACHQLVVARDDLHRNPAGSQRLKRHPGAGLWRIEKGGKPGKHQFAFITHHGIHQGAGFALPGNGQHAKPILAQLAEQRLRLLMRGVIERLQTGSIRAARLATARFILGAQAQHVLRRALEHQQALAAPLHQHRYASALKVERHLIDLGPT